MVISRAANSGSASAGEPAYMRDAIILENSEKSNFAFLCSPVLAAKQIDRGEFRVSNVYPYSEYSGFLVRISTYLQIPSPIRSRAASILLYPPKAGRVLHSFSPLIRWMFCSTIAPHLASSKQQAECSPPIDSLLRDLPVPEKINSGGAGEWVIISPSLSAHTF